MIGETILLMFFSDHAPCNKTLIRLSQTPVPAPQPIQVKIDIQMTRVAGPGVNCITPGIMKQVAKGG